MAAAKLFRRTEEVTVVLVHTDDAPLDPRLLDQVLHSVEPPAGGHRVVVVDCGADGAARPWNVAGIRVEVIGGSPSLTIGSARNRGAEIAGTPYVAFLGDCAGVDAKWLRDAVGRLRIDASVAAVSPGDGTGIPSVSFTAFPGTPGEAADAPSVAYETLAPLHHAVVFDAAHFRHLGSYDERLSGPAASLDLGWRAWIQGFRIVRSPSTVAEPTPARTDTVADFERSQLESLVTVFKNYESASLQLVLPACLGLAAARGTQRGAAHAAASARAIETFHREMPALVKSRDDVQARRQRTDAELLRLFRNPLAPAADDHRLHGDYASAIEAYGLESRFGTRRRIVVATPDVLTTKMAGPAIRAWQISSALALEHDVVLVTTSPVCEVGSTTFGVEAADDARMRELEQWADIIVLQGFVLEGRPYLRDTKKIMVVDIYDPLHLEQLELERDADDGRRRLTLRNATAVLNDQLVRGDFFICASPKQRDFWLGQLSGLGRINPLTYDHDETLFSLLGIVPFGLPDHPPTHRGRVLKGVVPGIAPTDEVILWGGGIYNWFDPLTLVHAVDRLRRRRPQVRLFFMGMKHPNPDVAEMRMASATRQLADELGLTGVHVFFNEGWVAYEDRQNYLLEADIGVSTHLDHVETAFSFRTRILDYIWAGVPIVATSGDAFAELIETEQLGITVPAGDIEALEAAMFRILDDPESAALCRKRFDLVRPRFAWSVVLEPLLDFCRTARRAPDLADPEMAASLRPPPRWSEPAEHTTMAPPAIGGALGHFRRGGVGAVGIAVLRRLRRELAAH